MTDKVRAVSVSAEDPPLLNSSTGSPALLVPWEEDTASSEGDKQRHRVKGCGCISMRLCTALINGPLVQQHKQMSQKMASTLS